MKRNIILLPRVIDDIKSLYAKLNKDALPLSQQLSIDFCPNDRGLIYREYGDSIQVWSEDMYLRCQYASEKDSLKVVRVEACQKFQYHFMLEKGKVLEGQWKFITTREANELELWNDTDEQDNLQTDIEQNRLENEFSSEEYREYKQYEEYWEKHDIVKKYEEENLLIKKKDSILSYKKYSIDFGENYIIFMVQKTDYVYRSGDRITIATSEKWESEYELENEHIKYMRGLSVGTVHKYDMNNGRLIVESDAETLRIIAEDKRYKKGYIWNDDRGSRSKLKRESEALKKLFAGDTVNPNLKNFIPEIGSLSVKKTAQVNKNLFSDKYAQLQDNQREAVIGALECSDIYLIQGPPGTGKTTVISEIIQYLVQENKKVLLSSQTNLAVDNVLQRIGDKKRVHAIRIGREEKFELDSKKYMLDYRVTELQKNILTKLHSRKSNFLALKSELEREEDIYNAHLYMQKNGRKILRLLKNLASLQRNVVQKEKEFANTQTELVEIQKFVLQFENQYRMKLPELKRMFELQKVSSNSLEENLLCAKIDAALELSLEEEEDIKNYSSMMEEIKIALKHEKDDSQEKRRQMELAEKLLEEIEDCKETVLHLQLQETQVTVGVRPYLLEDIRRYKNRIELLRMDVSDITYRIQDLENSCNERKEYIYEIKRKALEIKQTIECYIEEYARVWRECFGTERITKEQFLDIFSKLSSYRAEFGQTKIDESIFPILTEYNVYLNQQQRTMELQHEVQEVETSLHIAQTEFENANEKLDALTSNSYIKEYLEFYKIDIQDVYSDEQKLCCNNYVQAYEQKMQKLELFQKTQDIQDEWSNSLECYQECFETIYIKSSNLICATCLGIASTDNNYFLNTVFDYVIIDEAARASSRELLIPMIRGKKIVLVGDHKQISPEIERNILEKMEREQEVDTDEINEIYRKSLFGLLYENAYEEHKKFLNKQFRMSFDISNMVSKQYYEGKLLDGENIIDKSHSLERVFRNAFYWVDTHASYVEQVEGTSYYNSGEITIVKKILQYLDCNLKKDKTIGIIAPYKPQVVRIADALKNEKFEHLDVEINTVDAFQGREKNFIIMSLVRNNDKTKNNIGMIGKDSEINVALSRAQELLFVVGNRDYVIKNKRKIHKIYDTILHLEKKQCILSESSFELGGIDESSEN